MKKELKVGVVGAGGRVGIELLSLIRSNPLWIPELGIGTKSAGFINNFKQIEDARGIPLDVVIDFSSPDLFETALDFCVDYKIPLVSGTTGLSADQFVKMNAASKSIALLWSSNMSIGVAILKKALQSFQGADHFDFQIEEWHHRYKKDRPSGTAIDIQKTLEGIIKRDCPPAMVLRGGGIFGVHKVIAASDEEVIQFEHTALNRTVFARGALAASEWIKNKKPGLYTMSDFIS